MFSCLVVVTVSSAPRFFCIIIKQGLIVFGLHRKSTFPFACPFRFSFSFNY